MKLPRSIAALAGPSTPELQKSFLNDLKQAFRERVQHRAPPLKSTINDHMQKILQPNLTADLNSRQSSLSLSVTHAARELYIQGKLTSPALYDLLGRSTTRQDLDSIREYALKSGMDLSNQHTNLSARYAAKLLHLGCLAEVGHMIERNTKQWIMTPSAHLVLIQYTCRSPRGFEGARQIFEHLLMHDVGNLTTPLVRIMLRESIRANNLSSVLRCLDLDINASTGQEAGLAHWLIQKHELSHAYKVLLHAEPVRAKEGSVGLELAKKLMDVQNFQLARKVLTWVEGSYVLSLQRSLRLLEAELQDKSCGMDIAQHARTSTEASTAIDTPRDVQLAS